MSKVKLEEDDHPLLHAAVEGNVERLSQQLATLRCRQDADRIADRKTNATALNLASFSGNFDAVFELLKYGAKTENHDLEGYTPLLNAVRSGHLAVVELLLAHGADLEAKTNEKFSALHVAVAEGQVEMAKCLVDHRPRMVNWSALNGDRALHLAAEAGRSDFIRFLIIKNALLDAQNNSHQTALHRAAVNGFLDCVKWLVFLGSNCCIRDRDAEDSSEHFGDTPLHLAAYAGHVSVVEFLLRQPGCHIELRSGRGETPLQRAIAGGNLKVINFLVVERGANVNVISKHSGRTPFLDAAATGVVTLLRLLANHGADVLALGRDDDLNAYELAKRFSVDDEALQFIKQLMDRENEADDAKPLVVFRKAKLRRRRLRSSVLSRNSSSSSK